MAHTLPDDVVLNILLRLPVKSLCRFKSVSKHFLSAISDPFFLRSHRHQSRQNPNLLFLKHSPPASDNPNNSIHVPAHSTVEFLSRDTRGIPVDFFTLSIPDSVYLLPSSRGDVVFFAGEKVFYACNPSTREFTKLPPPSDCTSGEINAGLGFNRDTKEYVLIHLFDNSLNHNYEIIRCETLRFSDGEAGACSWKGVDDICPFPVRGWGVYVDNGFYWMIFDEYDHPENEAIVSFDLEKEVFRTVAPPQGVLDPDALWSLVELRGFLCLVDHATRPFVVDIWAMKDCERHEWVKDYSIDVEGSIPSAIPLVLDYWDGEILMDEKQGNVCCYDTKAKKIRRFGGKPIEGEWTWLCLYTESFFSLAST
ncbi:F-box protein CPR30 [Morella rubra]|uniref:F-box protein CPR30 n=1 Tax=Morella rubra TaxID=262757 RepID=A0A6A1VJV2_9ROSI|nr:F-box protein CPR30 [Morella rubra]